MDQKEILETSQTFSRPTQSKTLCKRLQRKNKKRRNTTPLKISQKRWAKIPKSTSAIKFYVPGTPALKPKITIIPDNI
jgi:hypothetical protein